MLSATNFSYVRTEKENEAWTTEHKIYQFPWYRRFMESKTNGTASEEYLSAIVFYLYETKEDMKRRDSFPPTLTVYGNGHSLCGVHFQGRKCFEKLFYFRAGLEICELPEKENWFEKIPRTEISPPPFIAFGSYPPHGIRKYDIEISEFRNDRVMIAAGVSPEPSQCRMEVLLVPEEMEPLKIAKIEKKGSFWVPEETALELPTVTLHQNLPEWLKA